MPSSRAIRAMEAENCSQKPSWVLNRNDVRAFVPFRAGTLRLYVKVPESANQLCNAMALAYGVVADLVIFLASWVTSAGIPFGTVRYRAAISGGTLSAAAPSS